MINVTRQIMLLRKLLLDLRPRVVELAYKNGCPDRYFQDFEKSCWELVVERSLAINYPEVRGVDVSQVYRAQIYPWSKRVIGSYVPSTHKLVCFPKEDISGIWFTRNGDAWHYLDRTQPILWTEKDLDNFSLMNFGSWEKFLKENRAGAMKNPTYSLDRISTQLVQSKMYSGSVYPLDSLFFQFGVRTGVEEFSGVTGVAKAEDFTFYLKEIVAEGRKETPKMSEEQEDMVARIGALIDKRMEEIGALVEKRMEELAELEELEEREENGG